MQALVHQGWVRPGNLHFHHLPDKAETLARCLDGGEPLIFSLIHTFFFFKCFNGVVFFLTSLLEYNCFTVVC